MLTMVTMQQGQMGVAKFNTMEDSFKHRENCHALKRNIAGMNDKFESGNISKGVFPLIPARISKYITGTDRPSVVTRIFYAIKLV
jgi:hypothetical protein